jgi:peptide/nickel transport system permease protein
VSARWLAGKVLAAFLTLIFVLIFNFFLFRVMGDPTSQLARLPRATPEEIQKLRENYGLDKPILGQFLDYAGDTARLDLGISQRTRRQVWDEIWDAIPWTILLVGTGTLLATLVWIGLILILVFAVAIPIFPAGLQMTPGETFDSWFAQAADVAQHLVLPATALMLMLLGQYFVIMRSSMVDVLTEDFITVKKATGLPWKRVVRRHAVRNALLPLVTLSAIQFGVVMGGVITIETIFSWPGLGLLEYDAINSKDFPMLQGVFLVFSVSVILANLLADCLYFVLDPRVQDA